MISEIKVLAINGSDVPCSQTDRLLNVFVDRAVVIGMSVTKLDLCTLDLPFASARLNSKDELNSWQQLVAKQDSLVVASPVWWFGLPARLKNAMDHLTILEERGLLRNKVGAGIAYSPQGGEYGLLAQLAMQFVHMDMILPGNSMIFYRGELDGRYKEDIATLADRIEEVVTGLRLRASGLSLNGHNPYNLSSGFKH